MTDRVISHESERLLDDESNGSLNSTIFGSREENESKVITWQFDEAVDKVGFGVYQFILWCMFIGPLSLLNAFYCVNNMTMVFVGGDANHTCITPRNHTHGENVSDANSIYYFPDKCFYNSTTVYANGSEVYEYKIACSSWEFDRSIFNNTINTEWMLACDKEYLVNLSSTIYMLGFFTGCLLLGDLADRYGRRTLLLLSSLLSVGCCVGSAFSPNYEVFTALRYFVGVSVAGTRNSGYILMTELARSKDRGALGIVTDVTYSMAYVMTGFVFYLDPNWRSFQFYTGLAHILFLTYVVFLPESPRWLLANGKKQQTIDYFKRSARVNRKFLPPNVDIVLPQQSAVAKHSTIDLFRTPNLRKVGVVSLCLWFLVSLVYFGMSYNVSNLKGSIFVNNAILGAVEGIANFCGIWAIKIGRRRAIVLAYIIASGAMLVMCFVQGSYFAVIGLAMLGKFVISPCFSFIYVSTAELYPTQTRTLALGLGSGLARLGGALAPFIQLSYQTWQEFPYIIFSAAGFIGALVGLFLPETINRPLPDSIAAAEQMNKISLHCCRRKPSSDDYNTREEGENT